VEAPPGARISEPAYAAALAEAATLLPALLSIAGERLRPRSGSRAARRALEQAKPPVSERWVERVLRRPKAVLVGGCVLLATLAAPVGGLQPALADAGSQQRRLPHVDLEGADLEDDLDAALSTAVAESAR
jgi:uncharacterized membrane protein YdfJ with MMPL/SSD domain